MSKNKNDLTDKQLLAMGKKDKPIKKRTLFKEYAVKYINLGMSGKDSKAMRKELPAIAKRGAGMVMDSILEVTKMPGKLPKHQEPLITIIIYAGIWDEKLSNIGEKAIIYPSEMEGYRLEEV